ncbi:hypothetical protein YH62_10535 [Rhizobium sp. LC145]|nr:hypothetical protein YH62_10535 [Rhizobium sp. LC145]
MGRTAGIDRGRIDLLGVHRGVGAVPLVVGGAASEPIAIVHGCHDNGGADALSRGGQDGERAERGRSTGGHGENFIDIREAGFHPSLL